MKKRRIVFLAEADGVRASETEEVFFLLDFS